MHTGYLLKQITKLTQSVPALGCQPNSALEYSAFADARSCVIRLQYDQRKLTIVCGILIHCRTTVLLCLNPNRRHQQEYTFWKLCEWRLSDVSRRKS